MSDPLSVKDLTANTGMLGLDGLFIEYFIGRMGNLIPTTTFFMLLCEGSAVCWHSPMPHKTMETSHVSSPAEPCKQAAEVLQALKAGKPHFGDPRLNLPWPREPETPEQNISSEYLLWLQPRAGQRVTTPAGLGLGAGDATKPHSQQ